MAKTVEPMTSGPILRQMSKFAFPVLLGNLFQQLYNTVDLLIVGNYLGSRSLAAVSSSGVLVFMLVGFIAGIGAGAGVVVARYFGAGDTDNMRRAIHTTVAFGLAAGVIMTVAGVFLCPHILRWMGTPEQVMVESVAYLQTYFAGCMGLILYNVFVGILHAVGDSRHPLYYLIAASVVNLVLDVLFVAVFDLGVRGAALATIICQFFSAILCLIQLLTTRDVYRLHLTQIRFHPGMIQQIIRIGLPSGLQNSVIAIANVVVQSNINAFGEMAMAGYGAYSKIEGFGFLPINAFTMAMATFVGQNLGARQYDRVKRGARIGTFMACSLAEAIGALVFIFAPWLIGLFDTNPEVVAFGVGKARTAALFFFLLAYSHSISAVLRGAGKTMVPMIVMMSFWCVVRVSFLSIMVPLTHSIYVVYAVYPLTWGLSSIAFLIYYYKADWLHSVKPLNC